MRSCVWMYVCVCVHVCEFALVYLSMCIFMYVCSYVRMYVCLIVFITHIHTHIHIYTHIDTHIRTYKHTHTQTVFIRVICKNIRAFTCVLCVELECFYLCLYGYMVHSIRHTIYDIRRILYSYITRRTFYAWCRVLAEVLETHLADLMYSRASIAHYHYVISLSVITQYH